VIPLAKKWSVSAVCLCLLSGVAGQPPDKTYYNDKYTLALRLLVENRQLHVFRGPAREGVGVIVADSGGRIVKDPPLSLRAAEAVVFFESYTSDQEIAFRKKLSDDVERFQRLVALGEGILWIRDAAARALTRVGFAALTGDPNKITRDLVKSIARRALRGAIESALTDPDTYLRATALAMLSACREELAAIERSAQALMNSPGGLFRVEDLEEIKILTQAVFVKIPPAMGLVDALRAGSDVRSQIRDVLAASKGELLAIIPGVEPHLPIELESVRRIADKLDWLFQHYRPYAQYAREVASLRRQAESQNARRKTRAEEDVRHGSELTRAYDFFSVTAGAIPASEGHSWRLPESFPTRPLKIGRRASIRGWAPESPS
jgi:hypothetical protein